MSPMTVEHEHTAQEQELWDHMEAGEWDEIEQLRESAYDPAPNEKEPPENPPEVSDAEQFDIDYANAYAHYQDAHEAPEERREAATRADVDAENAATDPETDPPLFQLYGLEPAVVSQDSGSAQIRALGVGFEAAAVIVLDGHDQATALESANVILCEIDTADAGAFDVFVRQYGETTQAFPLTIEAPE